MCAAKPYRQIQKHIDNLISKLGSDQTEAILHNISLNPQKFAKLNSRDLKVQSQILIICMSKAGCKKVENFLNRACLPHRKIYAFLTKKNTNLNNVQIGLPIEALNVSVFGYCKEVQDVIDLPKSNKELYALLQEIEAEVTAQIHKD